MSPWGMGCIVPVLGSFIRGASAARDWFIMRSNSVQIYINDLWRCL